MSRKNRIAALVSGGVESAAMLRLLLDRGRNVQPVYVRGGHAWERIELGWLRRLLRSMRSTRLRPLALLELPVRDAYHRAGWSLSGRRVPSASTPDEAVYLPGRNVLLLSKAAVFCAERDIPCVAVGTLESNPFPDASAGFQRRFARVVSEGLAKPFAVERPFGRMHKEQVLRSFSGVRWELTFSCIAPRGRRHCGRCNKCFERRQAFQRAHIADPTAYASR